MLLLLLYVSLELVFFLVYSRFELRLRRIEGKQQSGATCGVVVVVDFDFYFFLFPLFALQPIADRCVLVVVAVVAIALTMCKVARKSKSEQQQQPQLALHGRQPSPTAMDFAKNPGLTSMSTQTRIT
jgi:hypothetical protein